jgi:spermidine/putrescine transport system substrate-binding protein
MAAVIGALRVAAPGGLAVVLCAGQIRATEELNALVWCDHTDPALLEPFEKQFDVKVNVKDYEGTGTALALIEQSRPGDWDVFVVDSVDVPRVVEAGLLAPLPEAEFPWADIFPELRQENLHFKDGKMYAAPEKFGYNTLAYNKAKVDPADMRRTPVLWDPKYKGRIAVYDYYIPLMGMVAIGLGMKPSDINEADVADAGGEERPRQTKRIEGGEQAEADDQVGDGQRRQHQGTDPNRPARWIAGQAIGGEEAQHRCKQGGCHAHE